MEGILKLKPSHTLTQREGGMQMSKQESARLGSLHADEQHLEVTGSVHSNQDGWPMPLEGATGVRRCMFVNCKMHKIV